MVRMSRTGYKVPIEGSVDYPPEVVVNGRWIRRQWSLHFRTENGGNMADAVVANQKTILANQKSILANQKAILVNQADIKKNQKALEAILTNQKEILKNQKAILEAVKK
jgi:hypothetical protein